MLEVFRRELPALTGAPIEVVACKAKPIVSRRALREMSFRIMYEVRIHVGGG